MHTGSEPPSSHITSSDGATQFPEENNSAVTCENISFSVDT